MHTKFSTKLIFDLNSKDLVFSLFPVIISENFTLIFNAHLILQICQEKCINLRLVSIG